MSAFAKKANSLHSSIEKSEATRLSRVMNLFAKCYAIYGVRLKNCDHKCPAYGEKKRPPRGYVYIFTRVIAFTVYAAYVSGTAVALLQHLLDKPSLLDFVHVAYNVTSYATLLCGIVVMINHQKDLSQLLFAPEYFAVKFHKGYFLTVLALNAPSFAIDIHQAVESFNEKQPLLVKIGYICGVYAWQAQTFTLCMYVQCEVVIRDQLRQLSDIVKTGILNEESASRVARAKHYIRSTIEKVNQIFGNVLLIYYLKLFTLVTLRIGAIILWGTERSLSRWLNLAYVLSSGMQVLQIFETTRLGSQVIIEAQQLGRFLYQPRRTWDESSRRGLAEARRVLEYREHFDALMISDSFVNRKATIFTFLGTMFTCIAIVLQFDYDVLKTLEMAKAYTS